MDLERIKNLGNNNAKEVGTALKELDDLKNEQKDGLDSSNDIEVLDNFKREVWSLKREEERQQAEKKGHATVHLNGVNPDGLAFEDMKVWEKIKDETITQDDLDNFNKELRQENKKMEERNVSKSRLLFGAFLFNKGMGFLNVKNNEKKGISSIKKAA